MIRPLPPFNARPVRASAIKRVSQHKTLEAIEASAEAIEAARTPVKLSSVRQRPDLKVLKG